MKKILIITLSLFILFSCTTENNIENEVISNDNTTIPTEIINNEELGDNNRITVSDLEKNISKLKDVDLDYGNLFMLNEQAVLLFNNSIEKKAIENNDSNICNKLDLDYIKDCKEKIFIMSGNSKSCDNLNEINSINSCKNKIFISQANEKLDETFCENIIDESEDNQEINKCKNIVFEMIALKNLDSKVCNNIKDDIQKNMCEEMVIMEIDMKNQEEIIDYQEEIINDGI